MNLSKFKKFKIWLEGRGVEILPNTSNYEELRFKGAEVGVVYKSGKLSGEYAEKAIDCFMRGKSWDGGPVNVGRKSGYKKEKIKLIDRDGRLCFFCERPLGDDITIEHLIALSSGGKNSLSNMVLMHESCNRELDNKPINEKINLIIDKRLESKNEN